MSDDDSTFLERHGIIRAVLRLTKIALTTTIVLLVLGTVSVMGVYFHFARDLPNIKTLEDYKPAVVSEVFARDGAKVGEFWTERRLLVPLEAVPDRLIQGFIASEDARFFEHHGVDVAGIARAVWEDIKAGGFVQGGSTITQQITRSLLLSRERKLARKIREAILATRLERNLNKKQILTLYLNQIYLGNRAYGVKAAAENYFHKSMDDLTIAEAAMIAGLSRGPSEDTPVRSAERAKRRQRYVLERMLDQRFITEAQFAEAVDQPLTIYLAGTDKDFNNRHTPHFTEEVRRQLIAEYGEKVLYEGGLRIDTTVDPAMYRAAEAAVRAGVEEVDRRTNGWRGPLERNVSGARADTLCEEVHQEAVIAAGDPALHIPPTRDDAAEDVATPLQPQRNYRAVVTTNDGRVIAVRVGRSRGVIPAHLHTWARQKISAGDVIEVRTAGTAGEFELTQTPTLQGALFSMEVKTGHVRAMIGGYAYGDGFGESEFNRATQSVRQPGSSFKPFVYSAALDKGFTYDTPVADTPVAYRVGASEIWSPKNYGGKHSGVGAFSSHITFSRNVPTVKIGHVIGPHYLTAYCRKMGLTSPIGKYLSMALGANGVYMNELVGAYATFGNYGRKPPQTFVTKITDVHGALLREQLPPAEDAIPGYTFTKGDELPKDLNQALWTENEPWIKKDGLELDPQELNVLYGGVIPPGYTITPRTAYLMVGLLRKVVEQGTATRVKALGRPVAGKTGTTNDETDTWFVGFTPELAAGVWVGYDTIKKIGRGEQGGRTAAPIFLRYMQEVLTGAPATDFSPPPDFPTAKVASLPGGSALYWSGGTSLREESEEIVQQRMSDRAVDFFEADFEDEEF